MMKKLVLLLVILCVSFSSCNFLNKEDETEGNAYGYDYMYRPRGNMVDMCDISVTYYKADGTTKTDMVTSELWHKTNYFTQGGVDVGYSVSLKAKDSCLYYQKDTAFNFHDYYNYRLSVYEGIWNNQWDQKYVVHCPITKDSLQRILDQNFNHRGIHYFLTSVYSLTIPRDTTSNQ